VISQQRPLAKSRLRRLAATAGNRKITAMAILHIGWTQHPPAAYTGGAVTVGNFDGVHRAHHQLVAVAREEARSTGGPAVVVTFDPPPLALLNPAQAKQPLTTTDDRIALLRAAGAERVVVLKTEAALLALTPEAFFEDVLLSLFDAKVVIEGYNFRFGRNRSGDTATMRALCAGAGRRFVEVPPLLEDAEAISSSRIRSALLAGDVTAAARWLGRRYAIRGTVEVGARRGRTIGFPTANLGSVGTLLPKDGVYAVRVELDTEILTGAANIGPNPTFGESDRKIEVHLLDFAGDLYGRSLKVEFATRLRDTRPFATVADLIAQLEQDVSLARFATAADPG